MRSEQCESNVNRTTNNRAPTGKHPAKQGNHLLGLMLALLCLLFSISYGVQGNMLQLLEEEFQKVVTSARPAVVKVVATHQLELPHFPPDAQLLSRGKGLTRESIGSGILIDTAGHIVTTTFDADVHEIEVVFHDGSSADAKLIGEDVMSDIAVLRVDTDAARAQIRRAQIRQAPRERGKRLPWLGSSIKIDSGSWVVTVGNSYGDSPILSFGIVGGWDLLPKHHCAQVIKINAPVTPGNSGGAVVNTAGEVVGMILAVLTESVSVSRHANDEVYRGNNAPLRNPTSTLSMSTRLSQPWVTFAMPIEAVTAVANEIIAHGKVARGWLGVQIEEGIFGGVAGVFIMSVTENSPAHKSGLLPKDIILEFDNHPVENYPQLSRCVLSTRPNTRVNLKIYRNGRELTHSVTLGER